MKKYIYLSLLFFAISFLTYGQSQRLVLLEHFTQASCGPCATYNPTINNLLNANPDKITSIMYHTSWPGFDPMYNHNTSENGSRTSYYTVSSVPNSVVDGNIYNGHPSGWNIATVDDRLEDPSPFDILIYHELDEGNGMFNVAMMIKATEDVAAGMKAQLAVIEEYIHFNNPPGSNGEVDFYNVMKKMLPGSSGTGLPAFAVGEYKILQYSWEYQNVYDVDELAVVGFAQNNTSKEILQSANSSDEMFSPLYSADAEITGSSNISQNYCIGYVQPHITIRNNGSDNLTSLDINYTMNNGTPTTYQWSGDLAFLESEMVVLPESNFGVIDMNTLTISVENPNEQTDEYPNNNARSLNIPKALESDPTVLLILKLDNNPEETTWEFTNSQGDVIHEGGPYTNAGQQIVEQYSFESTDCYTFNIYDAGGNGLTDGGSFAIGFGSTIIAEGNNFGDKAEGQFTVSFTGINDMDSNQSIEIFPNPVSDYLTLQINTSMEEQIQYSVIDPLGRELYKTNKGVVSAGQKDYTIDLSALNPGIYYISIEVGSQETIKKIILTK